MVVATDRAELHELIDQLADDQLPRVKQEIAFLLSGYTDRLEWLLDTAPLDDEPTTPDEDGAAEEAWQEYLRDGGISAVEIKRTLLS